MKSSTRATDGGPITEQPIDRGRQGVSPCGIRRGRSTEMTIEVSLGDEIGKGELHQRRRTGVCDGLRRDDWLYERRRQDEITNPQCWEQDLGKGTHVDRAAGAIHAGQR